MNETWKRVKLFHAHVKIAQNWDKDDKDLFKVFISSLSPNFYLNLLKNEKANKN